MTHDVDEDSGVIKPGQSLFAPEWDTYWEPPTGKLRSTRDFQEYGFASAVVMIMYQRGWWTAADLPSDEELATP